ncbi:tail fiber protein [Nocardioides sp.]|uniref:phage tail protein n=1 Tax=Nocardioides sp. TaxID=35761 RepID=UPI002615840C|nr:tail fiber protein [Nocardioides sp.]
MAEPFLGEIRLMSFVFPPKGWAQCNGQLMPINQNQALFSLLGTVYGGNGVTTFALPDLRGRVPISFGAGTAGSHPLGAAGGAATHTLALSELPAHTHRVNGTNVAATTSTPQGNVLGAAPDQYTTSATSLTYLAPTSVATTGGTQAHENRQPFLTLNFCIALQGIFPSQI